MEHEKDDNLYSDHPRVENGETSVEEFREKWRNGVWKDYIRVMRRRIERKRKEMENIMGSIKEDSSNGHVYVARGVVTDTIH